MSSPFRTVSSPSATSRNDSGSRGWLAGWPAKPAEVTVTSTSRAGRQTNVGTWMVSEVVLAAVTTASTPSTETVLLAACAAKFVPVMVAVPPSTMALGEIMVITGGVATPADVAVKSTVAPAVMDAVAIWTPCPVDSVHVV